LKLARQVNLAKKSDGGVNAIKMQSINYESLIRAGSGQRTLYWQWFSRATASHRRDSAVAPPIIQPAE
jgi:hypothetical protein